MFPEGSPGNDVRIMSGVVESIRGVLWARKRQPEEVAYGIALAHERYQPDELVEQAVAAE